MKNLTYLFLPLFITLQVSAQQNDMWIKTPFLGGNSTFPPTYQRASFELDFSNYANNTYFNHSRPLLRISEIKELGSGVLSPPKRDVLLFMTSTGRFGLSTPSPNSLFHLHKTGSKKGLFTLSFTSATGAQINSSELGINSTNQSYWLAGATAIGGNKSLFSPGFTTASKIEFDNEGISFFSCSKQGTSPIISSTNWKKGMTIDKLGRVRIGTQSVLGGSHKDFKLSVDGKIVAKKIIVTNGPEWADYVFAPDYFLMPLSDLKLFIDKNHHLPNVPSATEITEKGVDVFEMNKILLEKIEEMTLHLIQMEERMKVLENRED